MGDDRFAIGGAGARGCGRLWVRSVASVSASKSSGLREPYPPGTSSPRSLARLIVGSVRGPVPVGRAGERVLRHLDNFRKLRDLTDEITGIIESNGNTKR